MSRLGRYRIDGTLGQGGMGIVYRAHDPELERSVALKVLRGTHGGAARARLLREARAMAQLSHANVVTVFEVGLADGQDFVAMELIDGTSVDKWLATKRTLDEVLDVFVQAGRGLAAAHEKGLVHRDFKPHNVLVARDGVAIVTDFGLARSADAGDAAAATTDEAAGPVSAPLVPPTVALDETISAGSPTPAPTPAPPGAPRVSWASTLTATGAIVGTPAYMAPEQWGDGVVDARTDQFAYCVALWEAAAGMRPFVAKDLETQRKAVMAGPPPPAKDVPPWLDAILRRGLAPKASDRWPSMDAVIAAIAHGRGRGARRRRNVVAAGIGAVVVGAVVAFALTRGEGARTAPAIAPTTRPPSAVSNTATLEDRILKHLGALMTLPSEPGNAGDEYIEIMRQAPLLDAQFVRALLPQERPRFEKLAADPATIARVELLRRGARKKDAALLGVLVPWSDGPVPLNIDIPSPIPLFTHAGVLRYVAHEKAKSGKLAEALADLQAIVWIGWHLQREPLLMYNMIGVALSAEASEDLAALERDADRAGRWRVLAGLFRGRRYDDVADRRGLYASVTLDPAELDRRAEIVDNPDALVGARAEAMNIVAIAHLIQEVEAPATAPQRAHLARWMNLEHPRLRELAVRLAGALDLDAEGRSEVRRFYEKELK